jgi:hypothetical protein
MLRTFDSVEFVKKLVADLREKRFYGSLELKFEDGLLVLIRKTETIRPS